MITVLVLSAVPALLAAGLDSVGLALVAGAGLVWAAALYACSVAPIVAGPGHNVNEVVATRLSMLAATMATTGVLMILLAAI